MMHLSKVCVSSVLAAAVVCFATTTALAGGSTEKKSPGKNDLAVPAARLQQQMIRISSTNLMASMRASSKNVANQGNPYAEARGAESLVRPSSKDLIDYEATSELMAYRANEDDPADPGEAEQVNKFTFSKSAGCTSYPGQDCNGQTKVTLCNNWTISFGSCTGSYTTPADQCTVQQVCLTSNGGACQTFNRGIECNGTSSPSVPNCSWTLNSPICDGVTVSGAVACDTVADIYRCYPTNNQWCFERTYAPYCGASTIVGVNTCEQFTNYRCNTVTGPGTWCSQISAAQPTLCEKTFKVGCDDTAAAVAGCVQTYSKLCMVTTGGGCTQPNKVGCTSQKCTSADNPMCQLTFAWNCATNKQAGICAPPPTGGGGGEEPDPGLLLVCMLGLSIAAVTVAGKPV